MDVRPRRRRVPPGGRVMRSKDTNVQATDLGMAAVDRIHREMQIDEPWTLREERGFTWWGAWIRQRVWSGEAIRSRGETLWHVRAVTPTFRDLPDEPATYAQVIEMNLLQPMSAFVFDPEDGTISARCGAFVYDAIAPWLSTWLLMATGLQASMAWMAGGSEVAEALVLDDDAAPDRRSPARPRRHAQRRRDAARGAVAADGERDGGHRERSSPTRASSPPGTRTRTRCTCCSRWAPVRPRSGTSARRTIPCSASVPGSRSRCPRRSGRSAGPGSPTRSTRPSRPTGAGRIGRTPSARGSTNAAASTTTRSCRPSCSGGTPTTWACSSATSSTWGRCGRGSPASACRGSMRPRSRGTPTTIRSCPSDDGHGRRSRAKPESRPRRRSTGTSGRSARLPGSPVRGPPRRRGCLPASCSWTRPIPARSPRSTTPSRPPRTATGSSSGPARTGSRWSWIGPSGSRATATRRRSSSSPSAARRWASPCRARA